MTLQRYVKAPEICQARGHRLTKLHSDIANQLFPRPIKLSRRDAVWLEAEVVKIQSAQIAGLDHDSIRALVREIEASRAQGIQALTTEAA